MIENSPVDQASRPDRGLETHGPDLASGLFIHDIGNGQPLLHIWSWLKCGARHLEGREDVILNVLLCLPVCGEALTQALPASTDARLEDGPDPQHHSNGLDDHPGATLAQTILVDLLQFRPEVIVRRDDKKLVPVIIQRNSILEKCRFERFCGRKADMADRHDRFTRLSSGSVVIVAVVFGKKLVRTRAGGISFDQNAPTLQFIQGQENSGYGKFFAASGSQFRDGVFSGQKRSQNGVTLAIKNALSMFVQEKQRTSDNVGIECGPKTRP